MTNYDQRGQQIHGNQYNTINRRINISFPLPGKMQDWILTSKKEASYRAQTIAANRFLWVDGFLEKALQSGTFLQLQLQSIPSLVSHEREQIVQELQSVLPSSPTNFTGLLEVCDQTAGAVLLLGEPGSGKTILLLDLLRNLLARADHDLTIPLPVLLPLTTWKEQQSLKDWMIAELYRWYNLPDWPGERWIKAGLLIPLLDGLDEVSENARADCITAINDYCRGYGLTSPPVISCRTHIYEKLSLTHQLLVREAVLIQPLTEQQVQEYLSAFPDLEPTYTFIEQDEHLRDLKTTPLLLSILTQMPHNASQPKQNPLSADSGISSDDQQVSLFETYVKSMLSRRSAHPSYPTSHIVSWLSWMAWQLDQHNEAAFHHTIIGPDWLPPELHKRYIKIMTSLVVPIVTPIVTAGSFLFFFMNTPQFPTQAQTIQMVTHLIGTWGPWIVRGLLSIGGGIFLILFMFVFILPQRRLQNPLNSSQKDPLLSRGKKTERKQRSKGEEIPGAA